MLNRTFCMLAALVLSMSVNVSNADDFDIVRGKVFSFVGPSGAGKTTTISLVTGYIAVNHGTDDEILADLDNDDIFARGPNGGRISMREMMKQVAPGGAPASDSDDVNSDAEFEALFEGLPAGLKGQFAAMPRADAIKALKVLRGQMNLSPVSAEDLPSRAKSGIAVTGNTDKFGNYDIREVTVSGDHIWITDASAVEHGLEFVDGMTAFGKLFQDITQGLPVDDSSFFRIGDMGGFPIIIKTSEGDEFRYQGVEETDVKIRK